MSGMSDSPSSNGPRSEHLESLGAISIATMLKQLIQSSRDFEEHVYYIQTAIPRLGISKDLDELRPTFQHDFEELENVLENLRSKVSATKTALLSSGNHRVRVEALNTERQSRGVRGSDNLAGDSLMLKESHPSVNKDSEKGRWPLGLDEYKRYGRQLIMPEIGLSGQLKLKGAKVLIIGAGGLGCPAAAYLAGAGAGHITIVDGDVVEESNLHRQIMHTAQWLGKPKAESLVNALRLINAKPTYEARTEYFEPTKVDVFKHFSIILDCTDTPSSRYLISDAAVTLGIPLVSASALRTEGQIMILNDPPAPVGDLIGGPCYRCIFPKPPPAESVQSCGEGGILGPVVGVIGVLQSLEAIKVLTRPQEKPASPPSMLMFSAYGTPMFRAMKIRGRNTTCKACSSNATITRETLKDGSMDYVAFCGALSDSKILNSEERITVQEYASRRALEKHILLDVREKPQFELCSLPNSLNVPYSTVQRWRDGEDAVKTLGLDKEEQQNIYVVCRLGNDSQMTVRKLKEMGLAPNVNGNILDIKGGWRAWRQEVDTEWPEY